MLSPPSTLSRLSQLPPSRPPCRSAPTRWLSTAAGRSRQHSHPFPHSSHALFISWQPCSLSLPLAAGCSAHRPRSRIPRSPAGRPSPMRRAMPCSQPLSRPVRHPRWCRLPMLLLCRGGARACGLAALRRWVAADAFGCWVFSSAFVAVMAECYSLVGGASACGCAVVVECCSLDGSAVGPQRWTVVCRSDVCAWICYSRWYGMVVVE